MTPTRIVLLLAAVLFFSNLWGYDLWAPDEPYFGEGAREMVADGNWAVPHVNGVVTTDKPPLFFWLIAIASLPFGTVLEITARLPSALAGLGTVALTMRLGRQVSGTRVAALAGFVLITTQPFWQEARWAHIDSLLCFLEWIALSAFLAYRSGAADGRRAGAVFWLAAALAVLAKGPVGVLIPLGIVLVTLAFDRNMKLWRGFAPLLGPSIFAAVIGGWMALATLGGGGEYSVWGAIQEHVLGRAVHGMHHVRPPWYFLERLPLMWLPWTFLVPGAALLAWRRRDAADRFLLITVLFTVVFFSISTEKRELYVLPVFPAFALLVGRLVGYLAGWEKAIEGLSLSPRWATRAQTGTGVLFALSGVALVFVGRQVEEVSYFLILIVAVLLMAGGIATLVAARRQQIPQAAIVPGVVMAASFLVVATFVFPALNPGKSTRALAVHIAEATADSRAAGARVLAYDLGNLPEGIAFYSNGVYTVETSDPQELAAHLGQASLVYAVVNGDKLEPLPPSVRDRIEVLYETRLSRRNVQLVANSGAASLPTTNPATPPDSLR